MARSCQGVMPHRRHTSASVVFFLEASKKTCHFCSGVSRLLRRCRSSTCPPLRVASTRSEEGARGGVRAVGFLYADSGRRVSRGPVRAGREGLFEERNYKTVFPTGNADFYLSRFWLMRSVGAHARGR